MNYEQALSAFELFNKLVIVKNKTSFSKLEKDLFLGFLQEKTYLEISEISHREHQTVKEAGPQLLKKIESIWNRDVDKKNFLPTVEDILQQHYCRRSPDEKSLAEMLAATPANKQQVVDENPFIPLNGRIDRAQLFFNRGREVRRVIETLNSGSSVALVGERQIGKSSILRAIERQAYIKLKEPRQPIYIDLQKIGNEDDFYRALCQGINIEFTKGFLLERAIGNRRLLLLLDEIEKMTWDGFTNNMRSQLRGLAEGSDPPIRLVVAARSSLENLFPDSEGMTSPFAGICVQEKINRWGEETMSGFIKTRLDYYRLKADAKLVYFTEEDMARLMEESGGHPQKLMFSCNRLYADYLEKME